MCDCVGRPGAAPERLTLCLRGRESPGGRHGGVREPAQKNGVQGESSARRPPGARPPLPSAPGGAWPDSAQSASPAGGPVPSSVAFAAPRCLSPCAGIPDTWPGEVGGGDGQQRRGTEAACHLPPALLSAGRVWNSLWGSIVFFLVFINTERGLDFILGLRHSTSVPV